MTQDALRRQSMSVPVLAWTKRFPGVASVLFGTVMLLGVLGVLARPAVFPDTWAYVGYGSDFYHLVAQTVKLEAPPDPPDNAEDIRDAKYDWSYELTVMGGRSPWYGVFIWPLERYGTIWAVAVVQCAIGAWLIWLLWRTLVPGAPLWTAFAVQGATALASTLPFIAGFVMPDVFTAYLVLCVSVLLVGWERLRRWEKAALLALVLLSCRFHGANTALAFAMLAAAGVLFLWLKRPRPALRAAVFWLVLALGASFACGRLTDLLIAQASDGQEPGRPPFVMVRLLADGPGRRYLRQACAHGEPYRLCRFKTLPLDDVERIMWSANPRQGVFMISGPATRVALEREETRFVAGTVLYDPVGVVLTSLDEWRKQLGMLSAQDPLRDPHLYVALSPYRESPLRKLVERIGSCGPDHHGCRPRLSQAVADWLQTAEFLLAAGVVAGVAASFLRRAGPRQPPEDSRWLETVALIACGLLVNAFLYGAIAGAFSRYQSAVAWLATSVAAVGLVRWRLDRPRRQSDGSADAVDVHV
jgi:hypothetical protein